MANILSERHEEEEEKKERATTHWEATGDHVTACQTQR